MSDSPDFVLLLAAITKHLTHPFYYWWMSYDTCRRQRRKRKVKL